MPHKTYKERYFEDYHIEKVPSKNGKRCHTVYIYHGAYCQWSRNGKIISPPMLLHRRLLYVALLVLSGVCFWVASRQTNAANTSLPVSVSGTLSILPLIFLFLAVARFCFAKSFLRQLDAEEIHKQILHAARMHGILMAITAVLSLAVGLLAGVGSNLLSAFCYAASAICSVGIFLAQRQLTPQAVKS